MPTIYFTSDTHFGHTNLNTKLRGMTNEYCDESIIRNWNDKVRSPKDKIYLVGDVTMEKYDFLEKYLSRLQGEIIVIGGNHDDRRCCQELKNLGITVMGCLEYKGYIVTHIPVRKEHAKEYRGNIHGHIHSYEIPSSRYINVCQDMNDYTPMTMDEIIAKQQKKKSINSYLKLSIKVVMFRYRLKIKKLFRLIDVKKFI